MSNPKATNFVSESILTETEQRFSNPKWFFTYLGTVIESEPLMSKWLELQIAQNLLILHASSGGGLGHSPLLARDIDHAFRRIAMASYYLGGRRFTKEMSVGFETSPPVPEEETGMIGEVEEKDFLDDEEK